MNDMRGFLTLANVFTSLNLVAGFLGVLAIAHAHLVQAAIMVGFAAIFDTVDGMVARHRGSSGAFGAHLDSLADLVSFGVVPAMAVYTGPLHGLPPLALVVSAAVVLASAWRLARFPLVKKCDYFVGLPVPVAGVSLMVLLLAHAGLGVSVVAALAASALMVSTVPFPTLPGLGRAMVKMLTRSGA